MHVSLTPELMRFVEEKIGSGGYADASAVVREGLCLLKRSDELRSMHRARVARDWLDAGQVAVGQPPVAIGADARKGPASRRS